MEFTSYSCTERFGPTPTGVPNHIFACPEQFGCEKKNLFEVSEESLIEVSQLENIDEAPGDYLTPEKENCFPPLFQVQ